MGKIRFCRSCASPALTEVLDLGQIHTNAFPLPGEPDSPQVPIRLVFCESCSLVQQGEESTPDVFFKGSYPYKSGITKTMQMALADIAEGMRERTMLRRGDVVVSIGCNDGTELTYYPEYLEKIGFEPAPNVAEEARANNPGATIVNDYFNLEDFKQVSGRNAKAIQAIACMYSIPNINKFLGEVRASLAEDGIFCAQLTGLKHTLLNNDLGNLTFEHCCFYSLTSLEPLFTRNGLHIFDYQENEVNGGSIRIWASPRKHPRSLALQAGLTDERALNFWKPDPYLDFSARSQSIRREVRELVLREDKPYGYAASTKGNLLLEYWGLGKVLHGIAERDERKWGRETVGTRIPILSELECRKEASAFLVLAFAFRKEMLLREEEFLKHGRFIIPLPKCEVYGAL